MIALIYFCMVIIAAAGCEEEILLIPESMTGDVYSSSSTYDLKNLLDGSYSTYWRGDSSGENVYYNFSSEVTVTKIFVQRYKKHANYFDIDARTGQLCHMYFGSTSSSLSEHGISIPFHNVRTDMIKFYFYRSPEPYISRADVYGCYNAPTPTTVPTSAPTELPTVVPTISPTLLPTTTDTISPSIFPSTAPTGRPSIFPTTAPTEFPSAKKQSTDPSTAPTLSPTEPPSHTAQPSPIPSISPSSSPTIVYADRSFHFTLGEVEFLVFVVVLLCGVTFFLFRRYKKVEQVAENSHKGQEREMQIVQTNDIEEQITRIVAKNLMNRKVNMGKTMYSEGENCSAEYGKSNQKVGEEKNMTVESHEVSDETVNFRFALDKVHSQL